jgi:NAD(P)-dependent dehydrogenase (short-subunit alcohol dehydrogenase family)
VTENRAREPRAYWGAMGATKAGMEHLVLTWAQEVATTLVRVNLFDPGPVATRMRSNAFPGEDRNRLPTPEAVAPFLAALCLPAERRNGELSRFE